MLAVGVRELKRNASALLRRVREKGEIIDITYRGVVVARLIPVREAALPPDDVAALMAEMDALAAEVSAKWIGSPSAVDAVHDVRREL